MQTMTRVKKVLLAMTVVTAVTIASFGYALSHQGKCTPLPTLAAGSEPMRAIVYGCYGAPDVLQLVEIAKPVPNDDQMLVKVHAAALNPLDWHYMRGEPYIMRMSTGLGAPDLPYLGVDYAGVVEAVGKNIKRFKVGDAVFGGRNGAFADYVLVREDRAIVMKPARLSFEQAAAIPIAAVTALQGLRDQGKIQAGQKVLINGASGGVGTFAVQIAKSFGAEVTGVCSTRNLEMVRAIGADHVIDYTKEDFTAGTVKYDLILDNVGNRSLAEYRRALKPDARFVIIGAFSDDPWLGPLWQPIKAQLMSPFVSQDFGMLLAELNRADLEFLSGLVEAGKLTPVIDRSYSLSELPAAMTYLEEGHARGKVVVKME
jgi:NADPH:quinone reductase-like Zn-dependent oxidoreductase